ncbi:MAG: hypothetical protein AB8F34_04305 [Akkermansiaceae bacterium]
MKLIPIIALLFVNCAFAQDSPPAEPPADPKEDALEQIFSSMGDENFPTALAEAKKAGLHPQILLEARFLHHVDQRDNKAIAAMADEFIALTDKFDPDNSEVFSLKEDWSAVVHYTQALAALEKGDKEGFKKHITEAFWLSPKQAQAFAPHIEQLRLRDAMASITLDPNRSLKDQETGKPVSIGQLLADKKALILHFWSPMSQEVQVNMPDFILTSQACDAQNIAVASILVGKYPGILKDAETLRKEDAIKAASSWIVDSDKDTLSNKLRIASIPTMVIVSPEGKILFNGQPSNKEFWKTVKTVAPNFTRPNNPEHKHADDHQDGDAKE